MAIATIVFIPFLIVLAMVWFVLAMVWFGRAELMSKLGDTNYSTRAKVFQFVFGFLTVPILFNVLIFILFGFVIPIILEQFLFSILAVAIVLGLLLAARSMGKRRSLAYGLLFGLFLVIFYAIKVPLVGH